MDPFLRQVAAHYLAGGAIGKTCFIFPNRRSIAFFRKYLNGLLEAGKPMLAPAMFTVNDFFYRVYDVDVTDRLPLLLALYDCYKELYPQAESLDEFVFWGDVILSDFDDVDKYRVDARDLYRNIAELKGIQDDYSYLTDTQRQAIERFAGHFRASDGHLTVDLGGNGVKARFLKIWNILFPLYENFRKKLREGDMAYEGMVYRDLADRLETASVSDILGAVFPETERYVFVGLNALNECEKALMRKMRDARIAEFCWDYVTPVIRHPLNKSSLFMRENLAAFQQAFPITAAAEPPQVEVISVPSSVGQVKLAPEILAQVRGDPVETAFVLPDENLLTPLLNTIPASVRDINVTMGYPLRAGSFYALMGDIAALQLHLRLRDGAALFYHRQVHSIFSGSLFRKALTGEEAAVVDRIRKEAKYYIPQADLAGGPLLELVFRPVVTDLRAPGAEALATYLLDVASSLGSALRDREELLPELDFAKRYYSAVSQLREVDIQVVPSTWVRLLDQVLQGISVPFQGEPLKGLQVMGPLETRALDFRNVVILSANEGMFPRRSVSSSFIPPELRKGFGLPTYEFQDAVWAYYFYRLLQRAEKVWMVYDSRTEGVKSGEESRYIKQLEYHFKEIPLRRRVAVAPLHAPGVAGSIPKTAEDIAALRSRPLSASALQNYLSCPAKFYYQSIKRLKTEDEVAESLAAGLLGTVYHHAMQALYLGGEALQGDFPMGDGFPPARLRVTRPLEEITQAYLRSLLGDRPLLRRRIRGLIREEMRSIEVSGRNLVLERIILEYVVRTLEYDLKLLTDKGLNAFRILGLERRMGWRFKGFDFTGSVDRIDSFGEGTARIVDYKTGKVEKEDVDIHDDNAGAVAEKLFGPTDVKRPKIALQLFLYDMYAREEADLSGREIFNVIYPTSQLFSGGIREVPQSRIFCECVEERLSGVLDELVDLRIPFSRTSETGTCAYCDFKMICGR